LQLVDHLLEHCPVGPTVVVHTLPEELHLESTLLAAVALGAVGTVERRKEG
jgi:hypothetical protein